MGDEGSLLVQLQAFFDALPLLVSSMGAGELAEFLAVRTAATTADGAGTSLQVIERLGSTIMVGALLVGSTMIRMHSLSRWVT